MKCRINVSVPLRTGLGLSIKTLLLIPVLAIGGCATKGDGPGVISKTLEAVGLKKPSTDAAFTQPKSIQLRLYAGKNLNAGNDGRPLAVVMRVYRLRQGQRFEQAPFDAFLDEDAERNAMGDDLLSATEIVLQPGQQHEITERLPPEASMLGVVALFRSPAPGRWRLTFDAMESIKEGVTVGLHACALTTNSSSLLTPMTGEPYSLTTARCSGK